LRLDRHVERADRLVEDHEVGLDRERARDREALALAARELVRIAVRSRGVEADHREQLVAPRGDLGAPPLRDERLDNRVSDTPTGVERRERILEHDLRVTAEVDEVARAAADDFGAVEADRAGRGLEQREHEPARRRLTTTRLPHQREGLAARDLERDVVDGVHDRVVAARGRERGAARREVLRQTVDLEERGHRDSRRGSGRG
jgi:hypothetical protein